MNSRLNLTLRERLGLAYNVESHYIPFSDTGLFLVYFGADRKDVDKCIFHIHKEFSKLCRQELGSLQLHRAKKQLIGQLAIGAENKENLMMSLSKTLLVFDRIESLEEIYQNIEKVTSHQILDVANVLLNPDSLSSLRFQ